MKLLIMKLSRRGACLCLLQERLTKSLFLLAVRYSALLELIREEVVKRECHQMKTSFSSCVKQTCSCSSAFRFHDLIIRTFGSSSLHKKYDRVTFYLTRTLSGRGWLSRATTPE